MPDSNCVHRYCTLREEGEEKEGGRGGGEREKNYFCMSECLWRNAAQSYPESGSALEHGWMGETCHGHSYPPGSCPLTCSLSGC